MAMVQSGACFEEVGLRTLPVSIMYFERSYTARYKVHADPSFNEGLRQRMRQETPTAECTRRASTKVPTSGKSFPLATSRPRFLLHLYLTIVEFLKNSSFKKQISIESNI